MAKNKLLGDIMVEMGYASRDVIIDCLNTQTEIYHRESNKIPLGTLLLKSGHLTKEQLDKALEKQSKYQLPS